MNVFITRINGMALTSIAQFAQRMTAEIGNKLGYKDMGIYRYDSNKESNTCRSSRYDGIIAGMTPGDIVIIQHPTWNDIRFEEELINRIKAYRGRTVIFIHDMIALMFESNRYILGRTIELFNQVEVLIVPSYAMKEFLLSNGIRNGMKFVIQEIWDYTTDIQFTGIPKLKKEIHFAGNPSNLICSDQWDYDILLKIYTTRECVGKNVQKVERMNPSRLLLELAEGGFGLVWYKSEYWHQYMAYNNSLKLSTYLAAGIPVIVPRGISNQYLIEENHLGIVADSMDEAVDAVKSITESDYQKYIQHVLKFAPLIRDGYFTKKLLIEAVHTVLRNDEKH